jgi:hypothetical protein
MLGFLSLGYYPSSPVIPKFAIKENILILFHFMYMRGPSSKHTYCHGLKSLLKYNTDPKITIPDGYKPFLSVYSAWLEVRALLQVRTEHLISSVEKILSAAEISVRDYCDKTPVSIATSMDDNIPSPIETSMDDNSDNIPSPTLMMDDPDDAVILSMPDESRTTILPSESHNTAAADINPRSIWISLDTSHLGPIPLRLLCRGCFGISPAPQTGYICFDGNFQHKRYSTRQKDAIEPYSGPSDRELRDQRVFVPSLTPQQVLPIIFNVLL